MTDIPLSHALVLSFMMFGIGLVGVMARRNLVFVLMSLEIMLTAAAVAFMAAAGKWHQPDGQVVVIFILTIAAAEVAVGLSILLLVHMRRRSVDGDEVSEMKG